MSMRRAYVSAVLLVVAAVVMGAGCSPKAGSGLTRTPVVAPTSTRKLRATIAGSPALEMATVVTKGLPTEPVATVAVTMVSPTEPAATPTTPVRSPIETMEAETELGQASVDGIEISITESTPAKVSVTVRGSLADGCTRISRVGQTTAGNTITVRVLTERTTSEGCTEQLVAFEETFELDIAGLAAGTYSLDVNGVEGILELSAEMIPPEDPSFVCPEVSEGLEGYLNETDGYCFLYPGTFEADNPEVGTLVLTGPAVGEGTESRQASLTVRNEGAADGRTAAEIADAYLGELGAGGEQVVRSLVSLGGAEAVVADSVPEETLVRKAFVVHDDTVFVLTLAPVGASPPQATELAEELWSVVSSSLVFIAPQPQEDEVKHSYEGWTLHEFDDLGVHLYAPADWVLTGEPDRYGLAPQGSGDPYLLTVSLAPDVPEDAQADTDALVDFFARRLRDQGERGFWVRSVAYGGLDGAEFTQRAGVCSETYVPAYGRVVQITLAAGGCDAEGEIALDEYEAIAASLEFYEPR